MAVSLNIRTGLGTTVTFGTTAFAADITGISRDGAERGLLEATHFGTTAGGKEYAPADMYDQGQLTLDILYDPDESIPIDQPAETITIQFQPKTGQTTGVSHAFSGFVTSSSAEVPLEDRMEANITIQISGAITVTAAT
jgi:hypothetical protein